MTDPHHNHPPLEVWRLKAEEWAQLNRVAGLLEDGKSVVLSQLVNALVADGKSVAAAEREAKASEKYGDYLKSMHNAREKANFARIAADYEKEKIWENKSADANARAERRMT